MKAVVLCGGESAERDVSLDSGMSVARALIDLRYEVTVVDPAADEPFVCRSSCDPGDLPPTTVTTELPVTDVPESRKKIFATLTSEAMVATLKLADVVFPALHGVGVATGMSKHYWKWPMYLSRVRGARRAVWRGTSSKHYVSCGIQASL